VKIARSIKIFIGVLSLFSGLFLHGDQIYNFKSPDYHIDTTTEGFHRIVIEGYFSYGVPGYPDLPSKIFQIAVPPDVELNSIEITFSESEKIYLGNFLIKELPPLATWKDGVRTVDSKADVYSNDAFYPERILENAGISQMRKWRIFKVKYTPFQYNPVTQELLFIPRVTLRIKYSRTSFPPIPDAVLGDEVMDRRAERILINYQEAQEWYTPSGFVPRPSQTHDYVIITTNAIEASSTQLANFLSYLSGKGFSPLVVTEDDYGILTGQSPNGTAEKIREWLINNYITASIQYVLLIGNPDPDDPSTGADSVGDVPMKMCWPMRGQTHPESPTDYFYADLTGNWDLDGDGYFGEYSGDGGVGGVDFANEVYVGRIPVYSGVSQLDSALSKTMSYGNASAAGITWRQNVLLPMSFSDATTDGAYLGEAMRSNYLSPAGLSSWTMYMQGSLCAPANSSFSSNEELIDGAVRSRWMSNPYGMVWWWGHGSETGAYLGYTGCGWGTILTTGNTTSLNDNYPSFAYQCSCNNGYPEWSNNLGTALLYNGAVNTVSASRVSWYAVTSWYTGLKYYCDNASIGYYYGQELVSNDKKASVALYDVKSDMGANHYTWWGGSHWMNLFDFNLYGDPALSLSESTSVHAVSTPNIPSGPTNGFVSISYQFTTGGSSCSQAHSVEYRFDWGDGSYSSWSSSTNASHSWSVVNTYTVRAQARCAVNNAILSGWSTGATITISACTPPSAPTNPWPGDGMTNVPFAADLNWADSAGATSYDVYFGTSSPPPFFANVATSDCGPGGLSSETHYYWQIVAKNPCGDTPGPEWDFTTEVVPNSPSNYQVLPEVVWALSAGGGTWVTEAQITDLTGGSQVSVYFNYGGGNRRGPFSLWTGPGANRSVKHNNLLSSIDALDAGVFDYYGRVGAVEFITQDTTHKIQVTARQVNGDYSKTYPGLNDGESSTADTTRPMIIQNLTSNSMYRTAVGCFNPTGSSVTVEFQLVDEGGNTIGAAFSKTFVGHDFQAFFPFNEAGVPYPSYSYDNAYIRLSPTSGSGRIMCFASTANNTTNDPAAHIAVQMTGTYMNSPSNYQVLPEVVWAMSAGGGTWVTEAQITDLTGSSQVSVIFNYGGGGRRGPFMLWTSSGANRSVKFSNLLSSIDALDATVFDYYGRVGAVDIYTQDAAHKIQVSVRQVNGDYSKTHPGLNNVDANSADTSRQMMIQNLTSNSMYRTAVGCFNLTSLSVTVEFRLIDGNGNTIGAAFSKTFVGFDYQAFFPFNEAGVPYPSYSYDNVYLRVIPTSGTGRIMCFASTANNTTNDPAAHIAVQHD